MIKGMTSAQLTVAAVAVGLGVVALVVPHTNSFVILLTTRALAFSILVISVDILLGFTGLASMGQAAYLGIGAYLTAILATRYHFGLGDDFWLVVGLAMLGSAALAAFFGLLAMRASGVYFLMITLALGQCVWGLAYRWNSLTGGDNGINLSQRPRFFGVDFANEVAFFYLVFAIFLASLLSMYLFVRSPFGRVLTTIRDNPERAAFIGVNVRAYQLAAFVVAGTFAGFAGALYGIFSRGVFADYVFWSKSAEVMIMALLGGIGFFWGPAVGAFALVWLNQRITDYTQYWPFVLGTILLVLLFVFPGGIVGGLHALWTRLRGPRRA